MKTEHRNICGGVTLHSMRTVGETGSKFKNCCFTMNFITELSEETASATSLLADVLSAGCSKYPTLRDIDIKLLDLYASSMDSYVQKKGEAQILTFAVSVIENEYAYDGTDLLREGFELLKEIVFRPRIENNAFCAEIVEREKKNLCDAIEAKKNNKNSYAIGRCFEEMCKGERFATAGSGTVESVSAVTPESLYERYKEIIATARVEMFYVGSADADTIAGYLTELFPLTPRNAEYPATEVISEAGELRRVTEKMEVTQGKLSLGFRTGITIYDDDYAAFLLFNDVFGSSPTSKLFMNVREKMSLCYYCRPVTEAHKGVMQVASGVNICDREKAEKAILEQLDEMKKGNISDEEIENGKRSIISRCKAIYDDHASIIGWYLSRALDSSLSPEKLAEQVEKCTVADLVRVADKVKLDTIYFITGEKA